jgi:hypothetical protein
LLKTYGQKLEKLISIFECVEMGISGSYRNSMVFCILVCFTSITTGAAVPGVKIDYIPATSGRYIGSPSLAVLPDSTYVASHDFFGPKSTEWQSAKIAVFHSKDRGASWQQISKLNDAFWSGLFVHKDKLYLMGTTKHHGAIVIRRSDDGGKSWTTPDSPVTGRLAEQGMYHTAPMPVVVHNSRIWRAFEDAGGGTKWGARYQAMMLSAPVDADLLKRNSWTFSKPLPRNPAWLDGKFAGWLEGNAVVTPDGNIVNILRVEYNPTGAKAAIVQISPNGKTSIFDPDKGFIDFPGGAKKFTIRHDPQTNMYWTISNPMLPQHRDSRPGRIRNTVVLMASPDLRKWQIRTILLYHPDTKKHGFQYWDWLFEGSDIIAVSRTAFDDDHGGAHNQHDANYLTFHRIKNYRNLDMSNNPPNCPPIK